MECIKVLRYVIPMHGNKRVLPYGVMRVRCNGVEKNVRFGDMDADGRSFIVFNRRRYYFRNSGNLYSFKPVFSE